ncbi:gamma-glutamyl hydrolase-like isoform X2 [Ischnura elegans]|uniref:gamma-glutamyl hydrolase-like isoform X2 n=1 Tax=Ischnura elegans TaxID=197161 RepID=UPI001ED875C7|nr:gamma-glutamyl hydrolase-like isoform X2 [Ischnura elegans]
MKDKVFATIMPCNVRGVISLLLFVTNLLILFVACNGKPTFTIKRPIIGILSQEITEDSIKNNFPNYTSYIAASYVKYLEGAGARVVPIMINQRDEYYDNIVNSVNGVLYPGGGVDLKDSGYGRAGQLIYNLATHLNTVGDYFPVWGTCLGFEMLTFIATGKRILTDCSANNEALPLKFSDGYQESKLFQNAPEEILSLLQTKPITANFHHFCLTEKNFVSSGLGEQYNMMSLSTDYSNESFVSAMESKTLPIYGVQFHPEKNSYEWNINSTGIPHSAEATRVGQYFAEFFVNEARKSGHSFPSPEEEARALIYNYEAFPTGFIGAAFDQCYLFN